MQSKTSTKPLVQKLGLKPNHKAVFLNMFYDSSEKIKADLGKVSKSLSKSGMAWVCWKKGNVTDLSRDSIWRLAKSAGLKGVSSCAINDHWSALKLMFPKNTRK